MSRKEFKIEIFEPDKTPIRNINSTPFDTSFISKDYIGLNNQGKIIIQFT